MDTVLFFLLWCNNVHKLAHSYLTNHRAESLGAASPNSLEASIWGQPGCILIRGSTRARFASEFPQVSERILLLLVAVELMVVCISGASGRVFDIQEGASVSLLWALT